MKWRLEIATDNEFETVVASIEYPTFIDAKERLERQAKGSGYFCRIVLHVLSDRAGNKLTINELDNSISELLKAALKWKEN